MIFLGKLSLTIELLFILEDIFFKTVSYKISQILNVNESSFEQLLQIIV
jgi:hypothetical protein